MQFLVLLVLVPVGFWSVLVGAIGVFRAQSVFWFEFSIAKY
jgi:multisubunit Na+/H+ antiporter MnhG subunit